MHRIEGEHARIVALSSLTKAQLLVAAANRGYAGAGMGPKGRTSKLRLVEELALDPSIKIDVVIS